MLEIEAVIAALKAYRARLKADGKLLKAMAVARRSRLVRALRDIAAPCADGVRTVVAAFGGLGVAQ